jgi:hypothetical protein
MPNAKVSRQSDSAVFTIVFRKGLADRNRLPLEHVIRTLQELDELIKEVGRQVQRERGIENPTGDFGIELLAGRSGIAFRKGSLKASAAVTSDLDNAEIAVTRVIQTTNLLEKKQPASIGTANAPIIRRLSRLTTWQRKDRTELRLEWKKKGQRIKTAKFGEAAVQTIESISAAQMTVEGLTLYGKLRELKDRTLESDEDETKGFWGELLTDAGERWRLLFRSADETRVLPLFRRQVMVMGDATYFKAYNPRLEVRSIDRDPERDYLGAFDKYEGSDSSDFGDVSVQDLLKELRD